MYDTNRRWSSSVRFGASTNKRWYSAKARRKASWSSFERGAPTSVSTTAPHAGESGRILKDVGMSPSSRRTRPDRNRAAIAGKYVLCDRRVSGFDILGCGIDRLTAADHDVIQTQGS